MQLLISRCNSFFAQCVAGCRAEHLQSKWHRQFSASVFSPMSRGRGGVRIFRTLTSSFAPLGWCIPQLGDVMFWGGLPTLFVLVYSANLDGLTLDTWYWDDSERSFSMAQDLGCLLSAAVLSVASQSPGTLFTHSRLLTVSVVGSSWLSLLLRIWPSANACKSQSPVFSQRHVFQMVQRSPSMLALLSSCMGLVVLWSMRRSWALPDGVTTPSPADVPHDILVSLKIADSVMLLWGDL